MLHMLFQLWRVIAPSPLSPVFPPSTVLSPVAEIMTHCFQQQWSRCNNNNSKTYNIGNAFKPSWNCSLYLSPGKNCLPWSQSLVPKGWGSLVYSISTAKWVFFTDFTSFLCSYSFAVVIVHSLSHVQLFATPWTTACQALCPPLPSRVCSDSCPLSPWCYRIISSFATLFSSCLQSFPESGSFQWVGSLHQVAKVL